MFLTSAKTKTDLTNRKSVAIRPRIIAIAELVTGLARHPKANPDNLLVAAIEAYQALRAELAK